MSVVTYPNGARASVALVAAGPNSVSRVKEDRIGCWNRHRNSWEDPERAVDKRQRSNQSSHTLNFPLAKAVDYRKLYSEKSDIAVSMKVISCRGVSKTFHRHSGAKLIRYYLADFWKHKPSDAPFYALKNVSFDVMNGESIAIIGGNGAGKSTLLSLVTGLAVPNAGTIQVNGRVAALLELGAGFHPDLTGAENVRMNAALLGFSRKETNELFDSIVEFSGVGDFIDQYLRTYSSGMYLRLAFSVAVNLNPDVLIVDEILAVGDQSFQAKCIDRIRRLRKSGKTLLFVSHNAGMVLDLCDRAIWLDHGELVMQGPAKEVVAAYQGKGVITAPPK